MTKIKVTGCSNCPLLKREEITIFRDSLTCNHPEAIEDTDISEYEEQDTPTWCPLKKEPITIEIDG